MEKNDLDRYQKNRLFDQSCDLFDEIENELGYVKRQITKLNRQLRPLKEKEKSLENRLAEIRHIQEKYLEL